MPEAAPATPALPPQSGAAPPAGPGQAAPPVGVSPATQSTPNRGLEMAGMQGLAVAVKMLESVIPRFGSGSEIGKDVLKALQLLNKHMQAGSVSPAGMNNEMQNQMRRQQQGQAQLAQLRQQMARSQGAGGAPPGGPPGGPPGAAAAAQAA